MPVVSNAPRGLPPAGSTGQNRLVALGPEATPLGGQLIMPAAMGQPQMQPVGSPTSPQPAATIAPASGGAPLIQSISVENESAQRVRVNRNSTAVIRLSRSVDRVDVADPTIADVMLLSPTQILVAGKAFGTTQLLLQEGDEQRSLAIDVELDLTLLKAFIHQTAPTSNVEIRSVNGTLFMNGTVPDAAVAKQITEVASLVQGGEVRTNLTIAGVQQAMLRVVVAEVNKNAIRRLGVNWAVGGNDFSRDFFFANNLGQMNPTTFGTSGLADVRMGQNTTFVLPNQNGAGTNITFGFPQAEFQMFVNALRENNLARLLAEPNLVAISGQTATFLAGGEVPIPVAQGGSTTGAVTIEYREFGVRLAFTPTVLGGQLMRLHVMTEVSDAVPTGGVAGGFPLFTFNTRRVESTIECGNGQTFAIAGLLNDQVRGLASKIPGLGDLPVLGTLFSSTDYERELTELVVLVTPQLVEPLDPHQVPPPPGSLITEPTDAQLFFEQKLEGTPKERPDHRGGVPRETFPAKTRPGTSGEWAANDLAIRGPWGMAEFGEK
ncbi:MAG: type II and III secretion system protein family protein [Phycisphaerales bacterium]|nr:type II and III secretion system protein family protein [Phycisphaerales bacterium]MCB9857951.1 type II and III secretion system protein family protein [Phycisphaerales bacterium]